MSAAACFAGVDVGGWRKGFDVAILDVHGSLLHPPGSRLTAEQARTLIALRAPVLVAIDSPCTTAPPGNTSRRGELSLNREVCGIRWTPDADTVAIGDYYDWIRRGRTLYDLLRADGRTTIEVFPTASWTRWHGERARRRRSAWSREALSRLRIAGVPDRTSQDLRDAIAAAATAYQDWRGETDRFGEIVVPRAGHLPRFERPTPIAS
jgi:predicted nuclease with RNAse H fold